VTDHLPSINANDIAGFCPACTHPTLQVGDGGHLVCVLMDCPKPEAADALLHGAPACGAPGPWGDAHTCWLAADHRSDHEAHDGCGWPNGAEAAIERVRAVACDAETYEDAADVIAAVRAALDEPVSSPEICELPHQTIDEEDACEQRRLTDEPVSGPATTQAADTTAARTARIRSLTLPAPGRQLAPHISRRLPGILHLGHRPTSLDMALIAEAADVSVDWLLYGDAGTPAPTPAGLREQPAPTVDRQTAAVLAALHRSAEADVSRVIDLYERWVKAGPPPLGASLARWWDMRLAELHTAILNPAKEQS
jgi:hypothetical protein